MSILVVGVNHRSAPLAVLERVTLPADAIPKSVASLAMLDNVREAAVLSTCNRTEIYAVAEKFHGAYADIRAYLADLASLSEGDLGPFLYAEHDDAAVRHLFGVASGLESAVIGDSEILGQVRSAWQTAQDEQATRSTLNLLFRYALKVGKRVRTETGIARGTASVSHAAVEMAIEHRGTVAGARVVVLGAGAMGEGIAVALRAAGVGDVAVVNRSAERGRSLADRVDGVALGFEQLPDALAHADLVLTGTGATEPVITAELMASVRAAPADRADRSLLLVDIGVPRDVAPDVANIDGVTILDLDDLNRWAERGHQRRLGEVTAARQLINQEVEHFAIDLAALQAAPLIRALHSHAEVLRTRELDRFASKLADLDADQRAAVDALTKGLVAKLLHEPSVKLRTRVGTPQGERNAAAVADLFELDSST